MTARQPFYDTLADVRQQLGPLIQPPRPTFDCKDGWDDVTNKVMRPVFLNKTRRPSMAAQLLRWAGRKVRSNWYLLAAFLVMVALSAAFPQPWF